MTDLDVVQMFHESLEFRGKLGRFGKCPSAKPHHKPEVCWSTAKRGLVKEIVDLLYPYMGQRRRQKMDEFYFWYDNLSTHV